MLYIVYYFDENDSTRYLQEFFLDYNKAIKEQDRRGTTPHLYDGVGLVSVSLSG